MDRRDRHTDYADDTSDSRQTGRATWKERCDKAILVSFVAVAAIAGVYLTFELISPGLIPNRVFARVFACNFLAIWGLITVRPLLSGVHWMRGANGPLSLKHDVREFWIATCESILVYVVCAAFIVWRISL